MLDFQGRGHRFRMQQGRGCDPGALVTFVCLEKVKTPLLLLFPTWWKAIEVIEGIEKSTVEQICSKTQAPHTAAVWLLHTPATSHDLHRDRAGTDVTGNFPFAMKGRSQGALGSYFHIAADSSYVPTAVSPCSVTAGRLRLFPASVHEMWRISGVSWLDDKPGR